MRLLVGSVVLSLVAIGIMGLGAEGGPQPAGKCVSIEVVLADVVGPNPPAAPVEITADRLEELETQGKLDSLARVRLVTLDRSFAMLQFGERVPVATARSSGPRTRDGAAAVTSYTIENVGTIVDVQPKIEPDGTIVVDLKVERSRLAAMPTGSDTAGRDPSAFVPQTTTTVSTKSTVRIAAGKTVVAAARESSGKDSRQTWILVTARIFEGK